MAAVAFDPDIGNVVLLSVVGNENSEKKKNNKFINTITSWTIE